MSHHIEVFGTVCFALAVLHTFLVKQFQSLALRFQPGSVGENLFHLLGEVEVVFGIWSGIFTLGLIVDSGYTAAVSYIESRNFTEPAFVFVIMAICATRPIIEAATFLIDSLAGLLPIEKGIAFYVIALTVGPILGSFITEPAAMTVTALLLLERIYQSGISEKLKYATLGLLFVNISIGGTLTPYAAPPVLMVASSWNWDLTFMLQNFGWKAVLAITISTVLTARFFKNELRKLTWSRLPEQIPIPMWVSALHIAMLGLVVLTAHHIPVFISIFLFFLGLASVTKEYQSPLKLKEGLLVGFFLGGLVVLGGPQRWWLEPLLSKMDSLSLYLGAIGLTGITDNAALTYLGSLVPNLPDSSKYSLVAGAVVGGGLTVIANAPNPAGFGILNPSFGEEGISPLKLFLFALFPTAVAALCFLLP